MDKQYISTTFSNLEKVNDEFVKCTISVHSYDQIANGTKFRKEAIEKALPTLNYCPVIGLFDGNDGDFKGHGIEYVITDNGFEEVVKTVPFGVVIKDSYRWEKLMKENGEYEEYVVADCYLWGRYKDAIDIVKENRCNQSMEVNINSAEYTKDYYDITDFTYSALCILGENVAPAFNLAKIRTSDKFSKDDFKAVYSEMSMALDKFLNFEQGGENMEDNKEVVVSEELEANTENEFAKDVEEKEDEEMAKKKKCEADNEDEESKEMAKEDEEEPKIEDEVEEEKEDYEAKYNEVVEELNTLKADFTDLTSELETLKSDYSTLQTEAEELRQYKANIEFEQHKAEVDEVLAKYSELETINGYSELVKEKYTVDIEELEKAIKVFAFDNGAVLTKKNNKKNFNKENSKIPVITKGKEGIKESAWDILDKYVGAK